MNRLDTKGDIKIKLWIEPGHKHEPDSEGHETYYEAICHHKRGAGCTYDVASISTPDIPHFYTRFGLYSGPDSI